MSDIQTLMRSANPIEDAHTEFGQDDLEALLLLTQRRSGDMDVKEVTTPVALEKKNNRGWLVAAATFAGVIAVVAAALMLTQSTDEAPPATSPTTTLDAAPTTTSPTTTVAEPGVGAADRAVLDTYLAAVASGDEKLLRSVLAPGLVRTTAEGYSPNQKDLERLVLEAQVRHARGSNVELQGCQPAGDRIQCVMLVDGPADRAIYDFQLRDNYWFTINGDQIVGMHAKCSVCSPGGSAEAEVGSWVRTFDPEAAQAMGLIPDDALSVEGGAAWLEYAPLWREANDAGTLDELSASLASVLVFEEAFNAGDEAAIRDMFDLGAEYHDTGDQASVGRDVAWVVDWMVHMNAQETTLDVDTGSCAPAADGVRCNVYHRGVVPQAIFQIDELWPTSFRIESGRFVDVETSCAICPPVGYAGDEVVSWVRSQNPEEASAMARVHASDGSAESGALWLKWAVLWEEAGRP